MADAAIGVVTEALLNMVVSLVAEEVSLAWGVKKELRKVGEKLEMIQAVLSGAQSKQITIPAVQIWLKKLQSIALDAQIVLEEFSYQVLCKQIECRKRDKVQPVESINSLPDLKEMRSSTVPYVDDSKFVGREDDAAKVISLLTKDSHDLPVITILGMGGKGKTTLAQMVYKSDMVKSYFDELIWVCVSVDFNVKRLLAEMQSSTPINHQSVDTDYLVRELKDKLKGKKYLLVLDDVWNEHGEEWEPMRNCLLGVGGSSGSKILATTRSENVASAMRSYEYLRLGVLSKEQSWELFEKCAFAEGGPTKTPQLVDIGERILKMCGGVPLAIKTIGGSLYSMHSESDWLLIERSEIWSTYSGGDRVLAAIKLSYDHLPSLSLKQCFAYCAIFEKDKLMFKNVLIQLWMAQGFLNVRETSHLQMEDLGDMYYNILLRNSLFQDASISWDGYERCKMHDLVHDVSLQVSENYCLHIEDDKTLRNEVDAVHISVTKSERGEWKSLKGFLPSNLRTLYLKNTNLPEGLFEDLKCVVVLSIDNCGEELPKSIGKMKHLRFLDTHRTINCLPKWLTKLYHLQTLRVRCLAEVPKGFGNLINLRHIFFEETEPAECLFKGLGQLRNLQTLPYFRVGRCEEGCHIEELEYLNNLRGTLKIFGLENVGNYESAAKSNLSMKSNIQTLKLEWGGGREDSCDDGDVAEGLKPSSSVKALVIRGFRSRNCPSWVKIENLGNLVELTLEKLNKCENLPSLGDMPFLEDLWIGDLPNLKCIGPEFYGLSNVVSSRSRGSEIIVFPALRNFYIGDMESLIQWSDAIGIISSSSVRVRVFPSMEKLEIHRLSKLCVFPNLGTLGSLQILEVSGSKHMKIPYNDWNIEFHKNSWPSDVSGLEAELQLQLFSSLRHLSMRNCDELTAPLCSLIQCSGLLETLAIMGNPESWPKDLHHLSSLKALYIGGPVGADVYEVDFLPWPYPSSHSIALTKLCLFGYGFPRVEFLPYQIQYLTMLTHFELRGFHGLKCIPDWLGNLECLQFMALCYCKNLNELPSVEAFQRLKKLRRLEIWGCPLLQEKCKEGTGSEWPKIAHIPKLSIE